MRSKRIVVFSPTKVTGGPELLHQLVDSLRSLGHDARICYFPFDRTHEKPAAYERYNAPQTPFADEPGVDFVVPETATWILRRIRHAKPAIWWLSVDNYLMRTGDSRLKDLVNRFRSVLRRTLPLSELRGYVHYTQSAYARDFLSAAGIPSTPLSDYIGSEYLERAPDASNRSDTIAYNPKKGRKRTRRLIAAHPQLRFTAIENMTRTEVVSLLRNAKVYVDFGHHPGKDRLPREAAAAGCCVVTGRRGAATNPEDVPISDFYKLDDSNGSYVNEFGPVAHSIFTDFASHFKAFEEYRKAIWMEPRVFQEQVESIFGRCH